jgi:uncharacterized membrane protein (DUF485 family)
VCWDFLSAEGEEVDLHFFGWHNVFMVSSIFVFFPVFAVTLGFLIRVFSGRKELLRMDMVQFFYAFVLTPSVIIWIKTVVFYILKKEIGNLNVDDIFIIDTVLTLVSLYIFSFVVIHSLTKTFQIKMDKDPLFDIFKHSEYFHLWLSHLITYSGGLLLMLLLGFLNLFVPLTTMVSKNSLYIGLVMGVVLAGLFYIAMFLYRVKEQKKFDKVIKIQVYFCTLIILTCYFIIKLEYSPKYSLFWSSILFFVSSAVFLQMLRRKGRDNFGEL